MAKMIDSDSNQYSQAINQDQEKEVKKNEHVKASPIIRYQRKF